MKPLLIIYMMSWAVTNSVGTELWLYKTCTVNFNSSVEVCTNLTAPANQELNNKVQQTVNNYKLYANYMDVPQVLVCLYLGPLSDRGRKPLMLLPFLGHVISGVLQLLNIYFERWDARLIWLKETYIFFGGYSLLNIAMLGYIGDVTRVKERTMMMAILSSLGAVLMPLGDFVGGQIYKAGQVYLLSLKVNLLPDKVEVL